jgi:hypothetical protein
LNKKLSGKPGAVHPFGDDQVNLDPGTIEVASPDQPDTSPDAPPSPPNPRKPSAPKEVVKLARPANLKELK